MSKILPNVRVKFLVRFVSKPLFYWVMTGDPLELFRKLFGAVRAFCFGFVSCTSIPKTLGPQDTPVNLWDVPRRRSLFA